MNVIVILSDSLRADFLGCYGNEWIQTPNIDRLADESALFERAYSEGLPTLPARTAMFTGRYTFPFRGWQPLQYDDILLSEVLWSKGYISAIISDSFPLFAPRWRGLNYGRGFDYVHWIRGQAAEGITDIDANINVNVDKYYKPYGLPHSQVKKSKERLKRYLQFVSQWNWWESDEHHFVARVVKEGISWLKRKISEGRRDKLFLWLDCFDPHEPWDPPTAYSRMYDPNYKGKELIDFAGEVENYLTEEEERHIRALYAGEVTLVDKWIGIFLENLDLMGILDNTLIIFISDHGEPLGRGGWGHGIIKKIKHWPYEELSHIPFILRHPEGIGRGKRIKAFIETCDVMPTILDFLNIPSPKGIHGESVLPLLTGEKKKIRDYAYSGYYAKSWSIRNDEWKLILWLPEEILMLHGKRAKIGFLKTRRKPELYNLKQDPQEQENLIDEYPDVANTLELELRRFVDNLA